MRFAISIPQFCTDGAFDPGYLREFLSGAEESGFESAWTQEQILGSWPNIGPIETMTLAATYTERIRLGCAVFVTPLHMPVHLAKSVSSLDQLSHGRVEVGVGSGDRTRPFPAFGIDGDGFITRFTEGVRLMKALWTEETVAFDGRFWQLDGVMMEPKPFQKPHPPLWFGGGARPALRRAVRFGDGFFGAGSRTTAAFVEQVAGIRAELADAGREPAGFGIAKRVYIRVDDDPERAHQRAADGLRMIYETFTRADMTPVAVYGPPEDCVRGLREVADAGAELILLTPLFDELAQLRRLTTEVLPHVG